MTDEWAGSPTPAPMPLPFPTITTAPSPAPMPLSSIRPYQSAQLQHAITTPSKAVSINGNGQRPLTSASKRAAAELISILDTERAQASQKAAAVARDADEARRNARTASEVARRYQSRSHPNEGTSVLSYEMYTGYPSSFASSSSGAGEDTARNPQQKQQSQVLVTPHGKHRYTFPRTPPSVAGRIAQAHAEDVLSLSLELERTKQRLEQEQMAHDETRNLLAEAKARNACLEQKLARADEALETQREQTGRASDSLVDELQRARLRVEAAEEDAALALELAKDNAESRDQLEQWLEQAIAEIDELRSQRQIEYQTPKSIYKPKRLLDAVDEAAEEHVSSSKRSVHFSDPISFSSSPQKQDPQQEEQYLEESQNDCVQPMSSLDDHHAGVDLMEQPAYNEQSEDRSSSETDNTTQLQKIPYDEHRDEKLELPPSPGDQVDRQAESEALPSTPSIVTLQQRKEKSQQRQPQGLELAVEHDEQEAKEPFDEPPLPVTTPVRPSRHLVSAGRKLLQQSLGVEDSQDKLLVVDFSPQKSARRRQQLREHLEEWNVPVEVPTPTPRKLTPSPFATHNLLELCENAVQVLRASGQRLNLGGHWWRDPPSSPGRHSSPSDLHLQVDSLARQYCQSVEVKLSRQKTEIGELESLCAFLEESIAANSDRKSRDRFSSTTASEVSKEDDVTWT